jgi:hypothetical protein
MLGGRVADHHGFRVEGANQTVTFRLGAWQGGLLSELPTE